jgi:flagellar motor component MotA
MTVKEKAKELINKFKPLCKDVRHTGILDGLATVMNDDILNHFASKQCALIAIDEIMKHIETSYYNEDIIKGAKLYWKEVKKEIEIYEN